MLEDHLAKSQSCRIELLLGTASFCSVKKSSFPLWIPMPIVRAAPVAMSLSQFNVLPHVEEDCL